MKTYDVIVIGAGVVGSAVARELSRYDLRIGVLEKELDVGCGNGRLLRLLDRAGAPELYGIDISPDMCRLARRRCRRADRAGRLHLTVGSVCGLPYPAEQFAAAVSVNTVYFWPDTVLGLSELCRCLRPGGRFLNVCYTKEWLDALAYTRQGFRKFQPETLADLSRRAGFSAAEAVPIRPGRTFAVICTK